MSDNYDQTIRELLNSPDFAVTTTIDFVISSNEQILTLLRNESKARGIPFKSVPKKNGTHIVLQSTITGLLMFFEYLKGMYDGLALEALRREEEAKIVKKDEMVATLPQL